MFGLSVSTRFILFSACASLCGCQLGVFDAGSQPTQKSTLSRPEIKLLEERLHQDRWQINRQFQLLPSRSASFEEHYQQTRWIFHEDNSAIDLNKSSTDTPSSNKKDETKSINRDPTAASQAKAAVPSADLDRETKDDKLASNALVTDLSGNHQSIEKQEPVWKLNIQKLIARSAAATEDPPGPREPGTGRLQRDRVWNQLNQQNKMASLNYMLLLGQKHPSRLGGQAIQLLEQLVSSSSLSQTSYLGDDAPDSRDQLTSEEKAKKKWYQLSGLSDNQRDRQEGKDDSLVTRKIDLSNNMRAAAAEVWCRLLIHESDDPVESLAPVGRMLEGTELPVAVHAELYRSVSRWVSPGLIPRLIDVFRDHQRRDRSVPVEIRRAAMDACLIYALEQSRHGVEWDLSNEQSPETWPEVIMHAEKDSDTHVRIRFGQWLSVVKHPRTFSILKSQMYDNDLHVREQAIKSLGRLQSEEAHAELNRQMRRQNAEHVRKLTVKGLAFWGIEEIAPYAEDRSQKVREAVAESLGEFREVESAIILRKMLVKSAPEVQKRVVTSVSNWENDILAIPLLLSGFRDSSLVITRENCLAEIRRRTGLQRPVSIDASPEERAEFVAYISQEYDIPMGYFRDLQNNRKLLNSNIVEVDEMRQQDINKWMTELSESKPASPIALAAYDHLLQINSADIPIVEKLLQQIPASKREVYYHDILPNVSETYAALFDMEHSDLQIQRRGSLQLARIGERQSLNSEAVSRLNELMSHCHDQLVWRNVMRAISKDASDVNAETALIAIQSSWWDIRILGCEYVGRHGRRGDAIWLMPLFEDPNKSVRLSAIEASSHCNHHLVLDGLDPRAEGDRKLPGLRSLLTDADADIRFAAVSSMCKLNDEQAMQELIRLSYSENRHQRARYISAMGASGQTRFVHHLIQMGWTETNSQVKQAILESLGQLVPKEMQPVQLSGSNGYDEQIKKWIEWQSLQKRTATRSQVTSISEQIIDREGAHEPDTRRLSTGVAR